MGQYPRRWINTRVEFVWDEARGIYVESLVEGYWHEGPVMLAGARSTRAEEWAFYNDDGSELTQTEIAAPGTNPPKGTIQVDTTFGFRIGVQEINGGAWSNAAPVLEYNRNSAGFVQVTTTSTHVQTSGFIDGSAPADGSHTTQRITGSSIVAYAATNDGVDDVDGVAGGVNADFDADADDGAEMLFGIKLIGAAVSENDTIILRVMESAGTVMDAYTAPTDPTITVGVVPSIYNPVESMGGVTSTTSADLIRNRLINPVESIGAVTSTSSAAIQRNKLINPVESIGGVTSTSSANLGLILNPAESIGGVTSTTSALLGLILNPAESFDGVTSTSSATIDLGGTTHNPAESIGAVTSTSSANLQINTYDERIAVGENDLWHFVDHTFSTTNPNIWLGFFTGSNDIALRFTGVNIPAGATIDVAFLAFTPNVSRSATPVNVDFRADLTDNSPQITDDSVWHAVADSGLTTAITDWDNIPAWVIDVEEESPSIVGVLQEVLDAGGLDSGIFQVFILDDSSTESRQANTFEDDPAKAPKLHIEYSLGTTHNPAESIGAVTSTTSANIQINTVDLQVGADEDDTTHRGVNHGFFVTALSFVLGNNATEGLHPTLFESQARFINVTIPKGANITVAHLLLNPKSSDSGTTVRSNLFGDSADDSAQIANDSEWHTRVTQLTTAFTVWDNISAWTTDNEEQSPDFSAVIKEIVDRDGWVSGNALSIFWLDDGSDFGVDRIRNADDFTSDSAKAPKLHIEYSLGITHNPAESMGAVTSTTSAKVVGPNQIGNVYQEETTLQTHTGDTNYTTKFTVLGSKFEPSTEYMMVVRAQMGGSIGGGRYKFRTQIGGSTPEGAITIMQPTAGDADRFYPYTFFHKFTTTATPEDVTFQIGNVFSSVDSPKADSITLFAMNLDDLSPSGQTDWYYGEDTVNFNHTTGSTWSDQASITFTPDNADDDWLIIAWGSVSINNNTQSFRYRISESVSAELEPQLSQEGQHVTDEELSWMLCRPYTLSAAEHIIKVQSNDSDTGTVNQHNISKIFALRLNAFENHTISWDGGTFNTPDTNFNELVDMSFTPDTTGNGIVFGSAVFDSNSISTQYFLRMQLAGTTIPTDSDLNTDHNTFDITDLNAVPIVTRFAVTASSLADVDIDAKVRNATADVVDAGFAAWSLELASGVTHNPVESIGAVTSTTSANLQINTLDLQVGADEDDVQHRGSFHDINITTNTLIIGDISTASRDASIRFIGVTIPVGATIDVAYMTTTLSEDEAETGIETNIYAHAADASARITTEGEWHAIVDSNLTTAFTINDDNLIGSTNDEFNTPSLVAVVQEVVDRSGFGEVLHFLWLNDGGTTSERWNFHSFDGDAARAPKLHIEYSIPTHVLDLQVISDDDDASEREGSFFSSGAKIGEFSGVINSYWRFTGVTIPQGATIIEATVQYTANAGGSGTDVLTNIHVEDVDNAAAITNITQWDAQVANKTVAFTPWDNIPAWTAEDKNNDTKTPNFASVLQVAVNRSGWAGAALNVFNIDDGSTVGADRDWYDFSQLAPEKTAELHIEFSQAPWSPAASIGAVTSTTSANIQINTVDLQIVANGDDGRHSSSPDYNSAFLATGKLGSNVFGSNMRFIDVIIPKDAKINSAKLTFQSNQNQSGADVLTLIQAHDDDDSAQVQTTGAWDAIVPSALTLASISWDNLASWVTDEIVDSPDISIVIQEIVDRSGWESGNAIHLFWIDDGSPGTPNNFRGAYALEGSGDVAKLHVEYSIPVIHNPAESIGAVTSTNGAFLFNGIITHLAKPDAAERSTTNTSLTEITERTVSWSDLTTAGFDTGDVVFLIWNWSLGASNRTDNVICNISRGTTFAGRTDWFPVDIRVEAGGSNSLNGHRPMGWVEEHTLVANENIYFSLAGLAGGVVARSANFHLTILKQNDFAAGDWRYDSQANAIAVDTNFSTGRDAQVTLPSTSGDDWLILGCGLWDVSGVSTSFEQRLSIDGVDTNMLLRYEGEDAQEQLSIMCVYPLDAAAASQVITFEGREDVSSSFVLDESRVLALRLDAFADHITLHDTSTDALSGTPNTYVETGTVDLVLSTTGDVFVIGQSIIDSTAGINVDPYLRLQENNADIISEMGRATAHTNDTTDLIGIKTHVIGSMTAGTKTIDMDVAQDESIDAANAIERSLVAFSLKLASGVTHNPAESIGAVTSTSSANIQINTYDERIAASADDVGHTSTHGFGTSDLNSIVGDSSGVKLEFAVRFIGVTIPQSATINVAYLTLNPSFSSSGNILVQIRAHDTDNSAQITTDGEMDTVLAALTAAKTDWDNFSVTEDVPINSPSIVDVIQELVDRPGWGNTLNIVFRDDGSAAEDARIFDTYDEDSAKAAKLHIEYSLGTTHNPAESIGAVTSTTSAKVVGPNQIGNVYQEETTLQTHTGDTTYTTKFTVLGSKFEPSTEYMMVVRAQMGGDNSAGRFQFRTQIGGSTPEGAETIMEPTSGNADRFHPYTFFHKFTTTATPEDVTFQMAPGFISGDTAKADSITLFAMNLDDLSPSGQTDWYYGEDTVNFNHTTGSTWSDQASITFTPDNADDDWLIIAWGSVSINNNTVNWRYRINESVSAELEPQMSQEGEHVVDEELPWMLCRPYTLSAAEHIIKVQSNDDDVPGSNVNQHNISKIFALRLNAFEQYTTFWNGGTFDTPDTNFNELADMSFTPDTTGNGIVFGSAVFDSNGDFAADFLRMQLAGTTIPTGSDSNIDHRTYDTTDLSPVPIVARFAVTASTLADVDIDCKVDNAIVDVVDSGFAAWSLELASGVTHNPAESMGAVTSTSSANIQINVLDVQIAASADDTTHRDDHTLFPTSASMLVGLAGADIWDMAMRFIVEIPKNAKIDVAHLLFIPGSSEAGSAILTNFYAHADDDSFQITDDTEWHAVVDANLTTAFVPHDAFSDWTIDVEEQSPSIVSIIQEIVDRSGWASGNALQIMWLDDGTPSSTVRRVKAWDDVPGDAPILHIEYSLGITHNPAESMGAVTSTTSANIQINTLDLQVAAGPDDVFHQPVQHSFNNTSTFFRVGRLSGGLLKDVAARFTGVNVPPGAIITVTELIVTSRSNQSGTTVLTDFRGELDLDATAIVDDTDFHARPLTAALVPWDSIGTWDTDVEFTSPNIASILQEIVSQDGWASGNAINVFWFNDGSTTGAVREGHSYDNDSTKAPKLHIEWSGFLHNPAESIGGVTSTTSAFLGRVYNPADSFDGVTSTSSADISIGLIHNPSESIGGVTSTSSADLDIAFAPAESFDGVTSTSSADLQRNRVTNPVESFDGATSTSSADIKVGTIFFPAESIGGVTSTSSAALHNEITPAEIIPGVTSTTGADLVRNRAISPAETLEAATSTSSAALHNKINPIFVTSIVLDLQVEADADDLMHESFHDISQTQLLMGDLFSNPVDISVRFTGLTILKDATISAAYLTFTPQGNNAADTVDVNIAAHADDDSPQITDDTEWHAVVDADLTGLVAWNSIDHWISNVEEQSPDISSIVQEIVDRIGWVSGNAIHFLLLDNGSSFGAIRQATAHETTPSEATKLHIESIQSAPISATTSTSTANLGIAFKPSESFGAVTSTTNAVFHNAIAPSESFNAVTSTTSAFLNILYNPVVQINAFTSTSSAEVKIGTIYFPAEQINGITSTSSASWDFPPKGIGVSSVGLVNTVSVTKAKNLSKPKVISIDST